MDHLSNELHKCPASTVRFVGDLYPNGEFSDVVTDNMIAAATEGTFGQSTIVTKGGQKGRRGGGL